MTPTPSSFVFRDGVVAATLDLRLYRLTALQKAAYRLAARCTARFESLDEHHVTASFMFPVTTDAARAQETMDLFFRDALDQELREKIGEETRPIRALILAHAFSKTDLLRRD